MLLAPTPHLRVFARFELALLERHSRWSVSGFPDERFTLACSHLAWSRRGQLNHSLMRPLLRADAPANRRRARRGRPRKSVITEAETSDPALGYSGSVRGLTSMELSYPQNLEDYHLSLAFSGQASRPYV